MRGSRDREEQFDVIGLLPEHRPEEWELRQLGERRLDVERVATPADEDDRASFPCEYGPSATSQHSAHSEGEDARQWFAG